MLESGEKSPSIWTGSDPQVVQDIFPRNTQTATCWRHGAILPRSEQAKCMAAPKTGTANSQRQFAFKPIGLFFSCNIKIELENQPHVYFLLIYSEYTV